MQAGIDHDPGGLAQNETRAVEVLRLQKFKEHSNHRLVSNFVRDARAGKVKRMHNEHSHDPAHGPCQTVCRDVACLECWQHNPEQCSVCRPWLERVLRSSVHHLSLFMANEPGRLQKGKSSSEFRSTSTIFAGSLPLRTAQAHWLRTSRDRRRHTETFLTG